MDRETTTIVVGPNTFVVKSYATAREKNDIQAVYFRGSKVELVNSQPKLSEFNPAIQFEVQLEMVRQLVISLNGTTEDIAGRCEKLPSDEFDSFIEQLDALVSKKKS